MIGRRLNREAGPRKALRERRGSLRLLVILLSPMLLAPAALGQDEAPASVARMEQSAMRGSPSPQPGFLCRSIRATLASLAQPKGVEEPGKAGAHYSASGGSGLVEQRGIEPLTSALRTPRSPN